MRVWGAYRVAAVFGSTTKSKILLIPSKHRMISHRTDLSHCLSLHDRHAVLRSLRCLRVLHAHTTVTAHAAHTACARAHCRDTHLSTTTAALLSAPLHAHMPCCSSSLTYSHTPSLAGRTPRAIDGRIRAGCGAGCSPTRHDRAGPHASGPTPGPCHAH